METLGLWIPFDEEALETYRGEVVPVNLEVHPIGMVEADVRVDVREPDNDVLLPV